MKKRGNMKLFLLFVIAVCIPFNVYAHPPRDISVQYSDSEKKLTVIVQHPSRNQKRHYVREVDILKNGKTIASKQFGNQLSRTNQISYFTIDDLKKGDEITIEAYCNMYGKLDKAIKVN